MKRFLQRAESRILVLGALLLFIAQLGAMSHAYSHNAAVGSATHQTGASSHDVCDDCLSYATVLCAAGAPAALPRIEPQVRTHGLCGNADSLVDLSLTLAFRSRAPPKAI